MTSHSILVSILTICLAGPAGAEIYRWADTTGSVHFTGNLADVPPEHRPQALLEPSQLPEIQHYESRPAVAAFSRSAATGEIVVPFEWEGSLMRVNVRLNDRVAVPFYVDTAASHVSIPTSVADQLGIDLESTTQTLLTRTANGTVPLAAVKLASVGLGAAQVSDVRGTINPGLEVGLLGVSFLNNFTYLVDTASQVLVLRPRRQ